MSGKRISQPPGGGSSFSLGWGGDAAPPPQMNTGRASIPGNRGGSTFSLGWGADAAAPPAAVSHRAPVPSSRGGSSLNLSWGNSSNANDNSAPPAPAPSYRQQQAAPVRELPPSRNQPPPARPYASQQDDDEEESAAQKEAFQEYMYAKFLAQERAKQLAEQENEAPYGYPPPYGSGARQPSYYADEEEDPASNYPPQSYPSEEEYLPSSKFDPLDGRFRAALLPPAGAPLSKCAPAADDGSLMPFERPEMAVRGGRRTNFDGLPSRQAASTDFLRQGEVKTLSEQAIRDAARKRDEEMLYGAVQPGAKLNSHVTGNEYARQLMQDAADKKAREQQKKAEALAAERNDEERIRREREKLRQDCEGEIEKQRDRHRLVEERDRRALEQHNARLNGGMTRDQQAARLADSFSRSTPTNYEGGGGLRTEEKHKNGGPISTSEYFEARSNDSATPHAARIKELREARWRAEQNGGVVTAVAAAPTSSANWQSKGGRKAPGGGSSINLSWG